MNSSINSLSALARIALQVESALGFGEGQVAVSHSDIDRAKFGELHHQINRLQVVAPNHSGVVRARVRWYEMALDSFETHIVIPAEREPWPCPSVPALIDLHDARPPELLAGLRTLDDFLRRHYLKDAFPPCFGRLHDLYRRLTRMPIRKSAGMHFEHAVQGLDQWLLEGRF